MELKTFDPCCKKTAIQAFLQDSYYLIGCHSCGSCFSITHDLQHFLQQFMASHKMNTKHHLHFDIVSFNGQIIFMIP
jgi:hypothetical protein